MPEAMRGFCINKEMLPDGAVTRSPSLVKRGNNREHNQPAAYTTGRSPLPIWYLRTPLGDITAISRAIALKRLLEHAAMAAARENRRKESSAEEEAKTPSQNPSCRCTNDCSSTPVEHPLPPTTPSTTTSTITYVSDAEAEAKEKYLSKSIEKMEKIVNDVNPKMSRKEEKNRKKVLQRRTLMSLR